MKQVKQESLNNLKPRPTRVVLAKTTCKLKCAKLYSIFWAICILGNWQARRGAQSAALGPGCHKEERGWVSVLLLEPFTGQMPDDVTSEGRIVYHIFKKKLRGVNQERYARMMFNKDKKMCEIAMVWDDGKFIMSFKHTRGQVNLMDESRENE